MAAPPFGAAEAAGEQRVQLAQEARDFLAPLYLTLFSRARYAAYSSKNGKATQCPVTR